MLFMLRTSVEAMLLSLLMPWFWIGLVVLVIVAIVARRRRAPGASKLGLRSVACVLSMYILPLLMLAWGLYFWPDDGSKPHEQMALAGLGVVALAQLSLCGWIVWSSRGTLGTALLAGHAVCWTSGALFTAVMAVTNTWL